MNQFLFFILLLTSLNSCSDIKGTIESRDDGCTEEVKNSKKLFLVNQSSSKRFQFTIKRTETIDVNNKSYSTFIKILEPGDELFLECDTWIEEQRYQKTRSNIIDSLLSDKKTFVTNGDDSYIIDTVDLKYAIQDKYTEFPLNDTLIGGKRMKYYTIEKTDSTKPLPRIMHKINYEITGQVEIKNDVSKKR